MGRRVILFFLFLLIGNLFIISHVLFVSGASDLSSLQDSVSSLEEKKEQIEMLTDEEARSDYLKKEWGKILVKKPVIGPMILAYGKVSFIVDPIFKYTIGLEPSWTWVFLLTLVLWITLLIFVYRSLHYFSTFSGTTSMIISLALMLIGGVLHVISGAAGMIINAISVAIWWVQLILGLVVIIGLVLLSVFSKYIEMFFKKKKEKRQKEEEQEHREALGSEAEFAEEMGEKMRGALGEEE